MSITLEVYGDFAMFTSPTSKVERVTYDVPTPSAIRGLLDSIYCKPTEFYWQVEKIEVLKPIKFVRYRTNEVKNVLTAGADYINLSDSSNRTQRYNVALRDVRYRITASIIKQEQSPVVLKHLYDQASRRINKKQCFRQPYLGIKECSANFTDQFSDLQPISETRDLGIMLYDVFPLSAKRKLVEVGNKDGKPYHVIKDEIKPSVSLFHAKMINGVIEIPNYASEEVIKKQ